jgi:hypothetical protein
MGDIQIIKSADSSASPTAVTSSGSNSGTVEELFIPKSHFSKTPPDDLSVCYVLDGGDSTAQPCDE